ncbi:MAG: adenylate/guanylate cyclase domain-containing protein [Proteobacteria bacterium]|nr:adenylate/guanylate cyclase domain-containing protein [Pseudomonadota bacterium]
MVADFRRATDRPDVASIDDDNAVQAVSDWLVAQGLLTADFDPMFSGFCEHLVAAGIPLWRAQISMPTLHPTIDSIAFIWRPETGIKSAAYEYTNAGSEVFLRSPFYHLLNTGVPSSRYSLDHGVELKFPILEEFRAAGATDYYLRRIEFSFDDAGLKRWGILASWTTDRAGGFTDRDIATLDRLSPRLALSLKSTLTYQFAGHLLETYVGHDAARRILDGDIRLGSTDVIRAVLVFADLRGFTRLADSAPRDELIATLNSFFDCMVGPITDRGGQVLKFIGDGLLAVFDLADRPNESVCEDALAAAVAAIKAARKLNASRVEAGATELRLNLALHLGDVHYGNIGSGGRQDFTVIGPAVNEAHRIETLCRPLECDLLISETFARAATDCSDHLVSLGYHPLRGIREPQELFTVDLI